MKTALSLKFPGSIQISTNFVVVNQELSQCTKVGSPVNFLKFFYTPNVFKVLGRSQQIYVSRLNRLDSFFNLLNRWNICFTQLQTLGFELWGLGLTLMPLESWWKTGRIWVFKVGFSHRIFLVEPYNLRIVWQHRLSDFRRRKFFAISNDLVLLRSVGYILRHLQSLNLYKFRGFKFSNEKVAIKTGKSNRV